MRLFSFKHICNRFTLSVFGAAAALSLPLLTLFSTGCNQSGLLSVNPPLTDGAVLQQQTTVTITGRALPGSRVKVTTDWGYSVFASAQTDSTWLAHISTPEADCNDHKITVESGDFTLIFANVLVGEVWVVAGQAALMPKYEEITRDLWFSNLTTCASDASTPSVSPSDSSTVVADSLIRFFVQHISSPHCETRKWRFPISNMMGVSPVALHFARQLQDSLQIPIGIVQAVCEDAPCISWVDDHIIPSMPNGNAIAQQIADYKEGRAQYEEWLATLPCQPAETDHGLDLLYEMSIYDQFINITCPNLNDWAVVNLPKHSGHRVPTHLSSSSIATSEANSQPSTPFDQPTPFSSDGVAWFVKNIKVPNDWVGKPVTVNLGYVSGSVILYANQVRLMPQPDNLSGLKYLIPNGVLADTDLFLAMRVVTKDEPIDIRGAFNFPSQNNTELESKAESYLDRNLINLVCQSAKQKEVSLDGQWRWCMVANIENNKLRTFGLPPNDFMTKYLHFGRFNHSLPSAAFNGLVAPLVTTECRGVIGSFGETDAFLGYDGNEMRTTLPYVLQSLRHTLHNPNLPIVLLQLPVAPSSKEPWNNMGKLRIAQSDVVFGLNDPNVHIVSTMQLGFGDLCHSSMLGSQKQHATQSEPQTSEHRPSQPFDRMAENGKALANVVLSNVYNLSTSPGQIKPTGAHVSHQVVSVDFDTQADLQITSSSPTIFEVAGHDSIFYPAKALAAKNHVTLFSYMVADPLFVRYAAADSLIPSLSNTLGAYAPAFQLMVCDHKENGKHVEHPEDILSPRPNPNK